MIDDILEHISHNSCIYIVLDALDECEPESRRVLLDWVQNLVESDEPSTVSRPLTPLRKILVTSRPDGSIFDSLSHFPMIVMTIADTEADMQNLIHSRIGDF
jgi:hypothetical protein